MNRLTALFIISFAAAWLPAHSDTTTVSGRFILSGFEPFGGRKVNASYQVAKAIAAANPGRDLTLVEVPVVWGAPEKALAAEKSKPWTLWLAFGEGTPVFSIETVADNRRADYADNQRKKPTQERILPAAPDQLTTPFPATVLAEMLRSQGLPVRVSKEAGNYLCEE
ncbi:MAG: hypothetical protein KDK97_12635, partial [Verrucomicrobiales bacterium]|nr:hypothetical protein [Verrucomicrobiales bacterium]